MQFYLGRRFVDFYYRVGPTIASVIQDETTRGIIKIALVAFSQGALVLTFIGPRGVVAIGMLLFILIYLRIWLRSRMRRRQARG